MSVLLSAFLLCSLRAAVGLNLTAVTSSVGVPAKLPPPHNLTMITLNTNYALSWMWNQPDADGQDANFTTQYVGKFELKSKRKSPNWYTVCEGTALRSCDLTNLDLHHLGTYMLRVRADANSNHSDWEELEFFPDRDAAVGPPANVELVPAGSDLEVVITDPLTSTNGSMKDLLGDLYYNILYWESSDTKPLRTQNLSSSATMVTLPNLKAWTWYCVRVQSCKDYYRKTSSFTPPKCMQTEGSIPWWQVFLYFIGSLVICFLAMLLLLYGPFWCYKNLKAVLYPPNQLPPHLKYLWDSPVSDIPCLLTSDSPSELPCDKVTVCPVSAVLEIHSPPAEASPPPVLEPDSRHSRQDSSSSGDSGVYSSGGSSNLQTSSQASKGAHNMCKGPFNLEQLKMQEMTSGLKTQLLAADDGIVDMCV